MQNFQLRICTSKLWYIYTKVYNSFFLFSQKNLAQKNKISKFLGKQIGTQG